MKIFITLISFVLLNSAHADTTFSCKSSKDFQADWLTVQVQFEGTMKTRGEQVELAYVGSYEIYEIAKNGNEPVLWGANKNLKGRLLNNPKYRPKKYKGYLQFDFGYVHDGSGEYGNFQLIVPAKIDTTGHGRFRSYFIMSYVNDHFGTTVPLECVSDLD